MEKYPWWWISGQNLLFVIYFGLGYVLLSPIKVSNIPIIAILYVAFLAVMLLIVLRKHLCTNCYYYGKWCSTGWGKLSSLMFKEKSGNYKLGIKLAGITWGIGTATPIIVGIIPAIKNHFLLLIWIVFLLLTPVVMFAHKKSCERCKMRDICPASMAHPK